MELFKKKDSKYWHVDFTVNGERRRQSTRATTKTKAMEAAAEIIRESERCSGPKHKGTAPTLAAFTDETFLPFIQASQLDMDTKRYYDNGWRMLQMTSLADRRIDGIKSAEAAVLQFSGSGSNANCALRTLRRILSHARECDIIPASPRIRLRKERERSSTFTPQQEKALLEVAPQPLKDVFLICQDSGLRPDEIIRMKFEHVLWDKNLIFNPYGKTEKSRRYVPLSNRVRDVLRARAQSATSQWVFPSSRKKGSHISYYPVAKQWGEARRLIKLPADLVLYCARHTFATDMLDKTGNLRLVQELLGHESIMTTQRYVHPEIKGVAALVNERNSNNANENLRHSLRHSGEQIQ